MLSALIIIVVGFLLAFVAPKWIKFGKRKQKTNAQFVMNILGIMLMILGGIQFCSSILNRL